MHAVELARQPTAFAKTRHEFKRVPIHDVNSIVLAIGYVKEKIRGIDATFTAI